MERIIDATPIKCPRPVKQRFASARRVIRKLSQKQKDPSATMNDFRHRLFKIDEN